MNQPYFLAAKLGGRPIKVNFRNSLWVSARKRSVNVQLSKLKGSGTLFGRNVVVPGAFWERKEKHNRVVVSQSYPQYIVSHMMGEGAYIQSFGLALMRPAYSLFVPKPNKLMAPQKGEILVMINAVSGASFVRVEQIGKEDANTFARIVSEVPIDVSSGIPASFLYDYRGNLTGIAITSIGENNILAFPTFVWQKFYTLARTCLAEASKVN